ncbi:MAG: DUF4149 domain-containing protein [Comamonadaceae bacterium]|nr:DUF4149 domain-containing protein [Comamonadaceae bacterium]
MLAVVVWVGGMFLMHFAVRPVAVAQLPPPQRLPLLAAILGRFFGWVTAAVLVVLGDRRGDDLRHRRGGRRGRGRQERLRRRHAAGARQRASDVRDRRC